MFISISMVNRGVSGIVSRKYNATSPGRDPKPIRTRQHKSRACTSDVGDRMLQPDAATTMRATTAAPVSSVSGGCAMDNVTQGCAQKEPKPCAAKTAVIIRPRVRAVANSLDGRENRQVIQLLRDLRSDDRAKRIIPSYPDAHTEPPHSEHANSVDCRPGSCEGLGETGCNDDAELDAI